MHQPDLRANVPRKEAADEHARAGLGQRFPRAAGKERHNAVQERALQRDAEFIQRNGQLSNERAGEEALQNIQRGRFEVRPAGLVLDGHVEHRHDHAGGVQRPCEQAEQPHKCLHPIQVENLGAKAANLR